MLAEYGREYSRLACQDLINILVNFGMTAIYVTEISYKSALKNLDKNTVLVYTHDSGEDVILLGDSEIDHVRLKFRLGKRTIRT